MKKITEYGKKLIEEFEEKCGEELMEESYELGTFILEKCISNRFDQCAWCLMTYDTDAIYWVEQWKIDFPKDFYEKEENFTYDDLLEILKKCITE